MSRLDTRRAARDTRDVNGRHLYAGLAALAVIGTACAPARPTPSEVEAAAGLARLRLAQGRHADAIRTYRNLLDRTDGAPFVRLGLAAALFQGGNLREAEAEYRRVLEAEATSPIALYNLAVTLVRQGRPDEAAVLAELFVSTHGETLPALAQRAAAMIPSATNAPSPDLTPDTRHPTLPSQ